MAQGRFTKITSMIKWIRLSIKNSLWGALVDGGAFGLRRVVVLALRPELAVALLVVEGFRR